MELKEEDFRAYRHKQPYEAFIFDPPEGENPDPKNLIDLETWADITYLSDDVSLRTSDNHGNELKIMYELFTCLHDGLDWVDAFFPFLIDITLEFQASLFNLLNGYYRVSAACLRNALELAIYGLYFQIEGDYDLACRWIFGDYEHYDFKDIQKLGNVCSKLDSAKKLKGRTNYVKKQLGYSLFNQRNEAKSIPQGISREVHSQLSKYVHSRPGFMHTDHWNNYEYGPIYSSESFNNISQLYLDTFLLVHAFIKLGRPEAPIYVELYEDIFSSKLESKNIVPLVIFSVWPELKDHINLKI